MKIISNSKMNVSQRSQLCSKISRFRVFARIFSKDFGDPCDLIYASFVKFEFQQAFPFHFTVFVTDMIFCVNAETPFYWSSGNPPEAKPFDQGLGDPSSN